MKTAVAVALLVFLAAAAAGACYIAVIMAQVRRTLPSAAQIASFQPVEGTRIYSSDGVLLARLAMENRRVVPLRDISPDLVNATIAVEDTRFYAHNGLDYRGIVRATWADLTGGDATEQGASTITQQLARNIGEFHVSRRKSMRRKIREAMIAVKMEQVFDKDTILELYLNQIYYGAGAYGAEAAARTYFGKHAKDLTLAEAALLAGLPRRPNAYSPYTDPSAARERRNVVLRRMLDTGRIMASRYDEATRAPIKLAARKANDTLYRAPYFVDWVVQNLAKRYGADAVYSGWNIVTTLDWRMQRAAERAVRNGLSCGATQAALVAIDPHDGEVRAMVGGVDYTADRFNAITQGIRQPGSAFKAIVYAAALDTGAVELDTRLPDKLLQLKMDRREWTVHDYEGYSNSDRTVMDAIVHSINTIAVQTAMQTGTDRIIAYARGMGITTDLTPYPSLALGASGVRPIELCSAYGEFAADGDRYIPTGVQSVTDARGRLVLRDDVLGRRVSSVLQARTIAEMNLALRQVVLHGTGTAAAGVPNAFGKTGTTSDRRDAWFIGYTPELLTAVWVGSPHRSKNGTLRYSVMPGATGGRAAAPIWARFMSQAVPIQRIVNSRRGLGPWAIPIRPLTDYLPGNEPQMRSPSAMTTESVSVGTLSAGRTGGLPSGLSNTVPPPLPAAVDGYYSEHGPNPMPSEAASVGASDGPSQSQELATLQTPQGRAHRTRLIRICVGSGLLATPWCPETIRILARSDAPTRRCAEHLPPPGE